MKRPRKPLPPSDPCPWCVAGERTAAALAEHNVRCAEHGERSYGKAVGVVARTFRLAAALALMAGCGRPFTGPTRCGPGFVADTLRHDDTVTVIRCQVVGW